MKHVGGFSRFACVLALITAGCDGGKGGMQPDANIRDAPPSPDALSIEAFLDPTFGQNGIVRLAELTTYVPFRIALAANDAFYVGGERTTPARDCGVARFRADGELDTTFADNGIATIAFANATACEVGGIAVQGTSVLVGIRVYTPSTVIVLCRITGNGALDATFGNAAAGVAGCAATESSLHAYGIAVLPDQTIHFGAEWDLYRYNANGVLAGNVSIFSDDPVYVRPRAAGGTFVAALDGFSAKVSAYSPALAPITSYGSNGTSSQRLAVAFEAFAANQRSDDRVLVAARDSASERIGIMQLTAAGARDPAWGTDGMLSVEIVEGPTEADVGAIGIRHNGDAYIFSAGRVLALDATGAPLAGFGTSGVLDAEGLASVTDTVIQSSGKLVGVGLHDEALQIVRFP